MHSIEYGPMKAYHYHLRKSGAKPARQLDDDIEVTNPVLKPEAA